MYNALFDDVKLFFMCLFMYFFYFEEVRVGLSHHGEVVTANRRQNGLSWAKRAVARS